MLHELLRQLAAPGKKTWRAASAIWLVTASVGTAWQANSALEAQRTSFEQRSATLFELIRQRLDQDEAVLGGLEALFNTFDGLDFDGIRGYAHEMLGRYPHIYSIELQPLVELQGVPAFEAWADKNVIKGYKIKDFGFGGSRDWIAASKRPLYYPITFMEPSILAAQSVLGLDVYGDSKFKAAIDHTITTGKAAVSAPFDTVEGGRGYLIFKAIFDPRIKGDRPEDRYRQATKVISMLIHTNRFLSQDDLPAADISLLLYHRDYDHSDTNGHIISKARKADSSTEVPWLSPFVYSKVVQSEAQPFVFETSQKPDWRIVQPTDTFLTFAMTALITILGVATYTLRRQSREAAIKADNLLRQERERALVTLGSISDAVIRVDSQSRVEYLNQAAAQLLGISDANARSKPWTQICRIEYELSKGADSDPIQSTLSTGVDIELPDNSLLVKPNDDRILIEGGASPLLDAQRRINGAVLIFRDMGPVRRRAKEALDASQQRLREHQTELAHVARINTMGEMASGIAHELNQPLAAILSFNQACVRLLEDEEPDLPQIIQAMRSASLQAKRAGEIIKRLRAFVSKHASASVPLDLRQVVQNALVLASPEVRDHGIQLTLDFPEELPLVLADSIQMEQVVLNLLRNAFDAMSGQPENVRSVRIKAFQEDGYINVAILDSGTGIPDDLLGRLFHPFITTKSTGMGLGLTICQSIIELYGGKITARNLVEGGAEFKFSAPISSKLTE